MELAARVLKAETLLQKTTQLTAQAVVVLVEQELMEFIKGLWRLAVSERHHPSLVPVSPGQPVVLAALALHHLRALAQPVTLATVVAAEVL
jgi:hypothetical protein